MSRDDGMAIMDDTKLAQKWRRAESIRNNDTGPFVLVVGEVDYWKKTGRDLPTGAEIAFMNFSEVTAELLAIIRPNVILSPLLCLSFDCLDLAHILQSGGFRGSYRVLAPDLPDPTVIKAEVRSIGPDLDFDVFTTQFSDGDFRH
ncbi:MAG: hypothetical protein KUG69_04715 [Marinosulfonomonas sp.]|nr:hypothetical protein [Marinosulfonomonas sp.]